MASGISLELCGGWLATVATTVNNGDSTSRVASLVLTMILICKMELWGRPAKEIHLSVGAGYEPARASNKGSDGAERSPRSDPDLIFFLTRFF